MPAWPAAAPAARRFQRTICERPGDDSARLVYADWLDENGFPEFAEFIRVQIGHEPGVCFRSTDGDACGWCEAWLDRHQARWMWPLAGRAPWDFNHAPWDFARGFLHRLRIRPRELIEHAGVVFNYQPIEEVHLCDGPYRQPWFQRFYTPTVLYDAGLSRDRMAVPREIFRHIPEVGVPCVVEGGRATFPRPIQAGRVVGLAAVAFGRREAGLPPLPPHPMPEELFARPAH